MEQNKYKCNNKYYCQQLHYKTVSVINNDQYEGEESVEADLHRLQNYHNSVCIVFVFL